ncbi:hypothetical protein Amsp01_059100 [Amycolatopsis sp. NBRC 101858]|uniref:DUF6294 family protein n=1 Tax=Amycolatopsis sp. NBRC 101858 TaxID=3032200 RepID=UPI0024A5D0F8|nr:DUF6294 family protein [Amycolatopsis sp. NBRC 101858]GLY39887.1 hypothetical protein Amsp01_059100 [Amycolatopsis sp. NBRC 101858]
MDPSVIVATANAAAERLAGRTPRAFTWGPLERGTCTMFAGARWTLFPGGTATFDGTVAGEPGRTWVIWHVDLLDAHGTVLGSLATEHPVEGDWRRFVTTPGGARHHRFRARANFDAGLWDDLAALRMHWSC